MITKHLCNLSLILLAATLSTILGSCQDAGNGKGNMQPPPDDVLTISVDLDDRRQTIHNFGASDAWSCQFVGKHWPLEKKEDIYMYMDWYIFVSYF